MPGRSRRLPLVGLAFAIVAAIGYFALGWRFGDGTSNPIAFAIAGVAVALAVGSELYSRL